MIWFVVFLVLMIPLVAVITDSPLGKALASRLERTDGDGGRDEMTKRLAALEREVERLNDEVGRLEEGTEFLQRLLEERGTERKEIGPGESGS